MSAYRPITILIAALGGEGGTVAMEWIVASALRAGLAAQGTSIPGVAQRTGSTTYYIEIDPRPDPDGARSRPPFSLYPVPGAVDVVIASELLEAARLASAGFLSERTHLIASVSRTLTTREKMQAGDGRLSEEKLAAACQRLAGSCTFFDIPAAAAAAGTVVSAVMFGALAGSGKVPLERAHCEAAIEAQGKGAAASRAGFAAGFDAVSTAVSAAVPAAVSAAMSGATRPAPSGAAIQPLDQAGLAAHARARLVRYQSERYAQLFDTRVARLEAVRERLGGSSDAVSMVREGTRFLAAWMMFDDVVRVAAEKVAPERFARIRREVKAQPGDLIAVRDYFKPRAEEILGLLPSRMHALARPLVHRFKAGIALRLRSDGVWGFSALTLLASLRWLRPFGSRYAQEQARIEAWLAAIETAPSARVALELALCGRLVKGYGATNARAHENLGRILDTLAPGHPGAGFPSDESWGAAIAAARTAALADGEGRALDAEIERYGVAPRPITVRPITLRRRAAVAAGS